MKKIIKKIEYIVFFKKMKIYLGKKNYFKLKKKQIKNQYKNYLIFF